MLRDRKKIEWLASRWLLHELLGNENDRQVCLKDEHGKPYLEGSSQHISLSHSQNQVAVIISKKCIGIDIQRVTKKIECIAPKFMRPEEINSLRKDEQYLEHLHVFWGAKECLYKAYGRRGLDFRKHIFVTPFLYTVPHGECEGRVENDVFSAQYRIFFEKRNEFILVYAIEK